MSIRTTDFDAVAASSPLDRQASVVRDGSGDLWDPEVPAHHMRWLAPPPMRAFAGLEAPGQAVHRELVGSRFGRLVCIGLLHDEGRKAGARWVVRCDCGYFEARSAKALRQPSETPMCFICRQADQLRQRAARPSTKASRKAAAKILDRIARRA